MSLAFPSVDMKSNKISNVADPTVDQDAATKKYVDDTAGGSFLPLAGGTMTGNIDMAATKLIFTSGINIGSVANTTGATAVAIGIASKADGASSIAIGDAAITNASNSISIGLNAGSNNTGGNNIAIGSASLGSMSTFNTVFNVGIGPNAGTLLTSGKYNTLLGTDAGDAITTGSYNTCIGYGSNASTGRWQIAIGKDATTGTVDNAMAIGKDSTSDGNSSIAIGVGARVTGEDCISIGSSAGSLGTQGTSNIAIGDSPLGGMNNLSAIGNIAIGSNFTGQSISEGAYNIVMGVASGIGITTGDDNICIGRLCNTLATGDDQIVIGYQARTGATNSISIGPSAGSLTSGINNIAIGKEALNSMDNVLAVGNTAVGYQAGTAITSGFSNVLLGDQAGDSITTGDTNVCIGYLSDVAATSQSQIAIGDTAICGASYAIAVGEDTQALGDGTIAIGQSADAAVDYSIAIGGGAQAGGTGTIAIGQSAGATNSQGEHNIAIGRSTLIAMDNITASNNTVVGNQAGTVITSGHSNTFMGYHAGNTTTTGTDNVCIGVDSDTATGSTSAVAIGHLAHAGVDGIAIGHLCGDSDGGARNISMGFSALNSITSGALDNVAIGADTGTAISGGSDNTLLGKNAGNSITSGDSNVCLGADSDCAATVSNQIAIGNTAVTLGTNAVAIGSSCQAAAGEVVLGASSSTVWKSFNANNVDLGASGTKFKNLYLNGNITVDGTVDGRDIAADGTKLNTIDTNADVTDSTSVSNAGALMKTGGTMTGNITHDTTQKFLSEVSVLGGTPGYSFAGDTDTGMWQESGGGHLAFSVNASEKMLMTTTELAVFQPLHSNYAGSNTSPNFSFVGDTNTGMYNSLADRLDFTAGGVLGFTVDNEWLYPRLQFRHTQDGSITFPTYSFNSDTDTGMYRAGTNTIGFSTGGVKRMHIDSNSIDFIEPMRAPNGSAGEPSYSFSSDTNTGMYRYGSDSLGFSTGGAVRATINTTGIVMTNPGGRDSNSDLPTIQVKAGMGLGTTASGSHMGVDIGSVMQGYWGASGTKFTVTRDGAQKPSGGSWSNYSDINLKEDIILADLDQCMTDISQLTLKRFKWKNGISSCYGITNFHEVGFIAQDVELTSFINCVDESIEEVNQLDEDGETIFIDGVAQKENITIKTLDISAIHMSQIGCTQRLIQKSTDLYNRTEGTRTATILDPANTDTILDTDHIVLYDVDINTTVTLPDNAAFSGRKLILTLKTRTASETLTINRAGIDTIDNNLTQYILYNEGDKLVLSSDGAGDWMILSKPELNTGNGPMSGHAMSFVGERNGNARTVGKPLAYGNGSTNSINGIVMPVAGKVTYLSVSQSVTGGTGELGIYKNGVLSNGITVGGSGTVRHHTQVSHNFDAGDSLCLVTTAAFQSGTTVIGTFWVLYN